MISSEFEKRLVDHVGLWAEGWLVSWSIGRSFSHNFLKGRMFQVPFGPLRCCPGLIIGYVVISLKFIDETSAPIGAWK